MIEILNVYKSFGDKKVLDGVNLTISNSDTICIIGKSGCGKSVLIKNIVGLLEPDEGKVILDGLHISKLSNSQIFELRKKIGFVFQGAALFDSLNVFENTVIGLYEHGERNHQLLEAEAKKVLIAVGLLPDDSESAEFEKEWKVLYDKKPSDLSGGMKKRVGVARALVGNPQYIFYDEPSTGLDPVSSEQIDLLIANLAMKLSVTSIVITHDMFSVFKVANRVAMLDEGKVVFDGDPESLSKSDNPKVIEFLKRYN